MIRKFEQASSAAQVFALLLLGVYFCYRGTTFTDGTGRSPLLPAAMAIIAGLIIIMIVLYVSAMMFAKNREEA